MQRRFFNFDSWIPGARSPAEFNALTTSKVIIFWCSENFSDIIIDLYFRFSLPLLHCKNISQEVIFQVARVSRVINCILLRFSWKLSLVGWLELVKFLFCFTDWHFSYSLLWENSYVDGSPYTDCGSRNDVTFVFLLEQNEEIFWRSEYTLYPSHHGYSIHNRFWYLSIFLKIYLHFCVLIMSLLTEIVLQDLILFHFLINLELAIISIMQNI